jgi:RNA polymerase sigma-70 factor (ECF subfamily)
MDKGYTQDAQFPDTSWTLLRVAGGDQTLARESMERLCRSYWGPLYAFARWQGFGPAEAEDVTQSFFIHLLEDETFQTADREKGKLRSFLLGALKHFMANWRRHETTVKRGGRLTRVDFDATEVEAVCAQQSMGISADEFYDRRWAVTLLDQALKQLEMEHLQAGRGTQFAVLSEFLFQQGKDAAHGPAAEKLGMNEGAVRVAVHRLRQRFRDCLRHHVQATVAATEDVDAELRHLLSLYAQ